MTLLFKAVLNYYFITYLTLHSQTFDFQVCSKTNYFPYDLRTQFYKWELAHTWTTIQPYCLCYHFSLAFYFLILYWGHNMVCCLKLMALMQISNCLNVILCFKQSSWQAQGQLQSIFSFDLVFVDNHVNHFLGTLCKCFNQKL